jgi:hypothetical protein
MALAREWIIFALCLGAGGHLALGFVLHAPDLWPWSRAGLYGLLSGLVIYILVQVVRFLWSRVHVKRSDLEQDVDD